MSAQYSTHEGLSPLENALQCVTKKALQSPEGKAFKHRFIKMTVPPLHQFTFFFTFL